MTSEEVVDGSQSGIGTGVWLGTVVVRQAGVLKLQWRHGGKGRRRLTHEVRVQTIGGEADGAKIPLPINLDCGATRGCADDSQEGRLSSSSGGHDGFREPNWYEL